MAKKIQVSTINQQADVEVVFVNARLIAMCLRALQFVERRKTEEGLDPQSPYESDRHPFAPDEEHAHRFIEEFAQALLPEDDKESEEKPY